MYQLFRNFFQEPGGHGIIGAAVNGPGFCARQVQDLLRPGNAHITQTPFLFHLLVIHQAAGMGEKPFFHACQEHYGEFQPFGGMQRHQCKFIVIQLGVVNVGYQRHMLQKMRQRFFFAFVLQKILGHADQFLQILCPAFRLGRPLCFQFFHVPGLIHYVFNELFHRHGIYLCQQIKEDAAHFFHFGDKTGAQSRNRRRVGNDLKQGNALCIGIVLHLIHRSLADAPLGHIDHPQQAQCIIRIVQQLQVGHHIPDLFPVIKLDAPHHAVADAALD